MLRTLGPEACPCDALHGWDLEATSCHDRLRGHPLQIGGCGWQWAPGGRRRGGDRAGVPAACGRHHGGGGGCDRGRAAIGVLPGAEEKMVEEQGQERPGSMTELPGQDVLQALAALQVELSSEHEKNCRAYLHFMHKNHQRRKPDLARRCAIIQSIPYFWAIAVSFLLLLGVCCSGGGGGAGTFSLLYPGKCSYRTIHGPTARRSSPFKITPTSWAQWSPSIVTLTLFVKHGSRSDECGCARVWMIHLWDQHPSLLSLFRV